MTPARKALWFIENHLADESISLDEIASASGVSRFHLSRAFATAFGHPVMRYVRARRLAEAARMLAAGAPDILAVALEAGYNSHEAFTRAFREEFGRTPEDARLRSADLTLLEPIRMKQNPQLELAPPRIVDGAEMLIVGLKDRCDPATIPAQWMRFVPHLGSIKGQIGHATYGLIYSNGEGESKAMEYIAGVEASTDAGLAPELTSYRVPAQRYAVFAHGGHVSEISSVWASIWNGSALQNAGFEVTGGPEFERYGENFDGRTGNGGFEIWIPVRERPKAS